MAIARRLLVNPANTDQRYVVWSNGFLEAKGSAVPITDYDEASVNTANTKPPSFHLWSNPDIVVAAQITDWTTPAGYVLTIYGHVWHFGSAATVPGSSNHFLPGTAPEYFFGLNGGTAQPAFGFVMDFAMNPAANGQGYYMTYFGDVVAFGTGTPAIGHSAFLAGTGVAARMLQMDWTSKRYAVLDNLHRLWGQNGLTTVNVGSLTAPAYDGARSGSFGQGGFRLYDFTAGSAKGWSIDPWGRGWWIGTAIDPVGGPYLSGLKKIYNDIAIINDGTGANPLRLVALTAQGALVEWVSSTAPTVTVLEPADPMTVSTRPIIRWGYQDAQNNPQATYVVRVFTAAQYGIGGFAPATSPATWETSGTDWGVRAVQPTVDLPNATYRAYVMTTDTSGLASATSFKQWVQNVTPMSVPTITPTVLGGLSGISLALAVSTSGLDALARFGVQYHDSDWDGATWEFVRGGYDIVPVTGAATLVDREARFGVLRTYRTQIYVYDAPTNAYRASQWSTSATATLTPRNIWTLTNPLNSAQGGIVRVQPGFTTKRPIRQGTFWPSGAFFPIVVTDGKPKAASGDLALWALTNAERLIIEAMVDADVPLLLRDPFGRAWYVKLVDTFDEALVRAAPLITEATSIRDMNDVRFAVQQVRRPVGGPAVGPLAEV